MHHAYTSLNKALAAVFEAIAPAVPVYYQHPVSEDGAEGTLPSTCFRVYWLEQGGTEGNPQEEGGTVQIDIFVGGNDRATALRYASELNDALGFRSRGGFGELGRFDYDQDPPLLLSMMRLEPFEEGWVTVPDESPHTVHLARTIFFTYQVDPTNRIESNLLVLEQGGYLSL